MFMPAVSIVTFFKNAAIIYHWLVELEKLDSVVAMLADAWFCFDTVPACWVIASAPDVINDNFSHHL